MAGTDLLAVAAYLGVMTPGIETVWEFLMSGFGFVLWAAVLYTVYRLARWGYEAFNRRRAEQA